MTVYTRRVLAQASVEDGASMDLSDALEVGENRSIALVATVHEAGTGESPLLVVEQAITNEEDCYVAFSTPVEIALDATGTHTFLVDPFYLRWLRWRQAGTLTTPATVTLDVIGKG